MKKIILLGILFVSLVSVTHAHRHHHHTARGYVGFGMGIGLPFGGVYYADGPQGSFPYYGTPVNYGGFYAPYGYAPYAGPVVTFGW